MAEQYAGFGGDKTPFDGSDLQGAAVDDFQEFWEIVECMGQEGWESAIAAWEEADERRSETNAERERRPADDTFAGGVPNVIQLKKVEKLAPDGKPAIPVLLELLQDRDERVRFLAASVLGGIGPDAGSAIPALTDLLKDESRAVRRIATKALKKIETEK